MRMEIYRWMKNLAFFHILTTAVLHILPDKRYEQYLRLFMGLLLVLLICTPMFTIFGKSQEFLEGFRKNYTEEEQKRMETEAEGIRETFLKNAYKEEMKNQIREILKKQEIFTAEIKVEEQEGLFVFVKIPEMITEQQKEEVKNGLEKICGLSEDQYQILDPGDGMEGMGNPSSGGNSSFGGGASGITRKQ